MVEYVLILNVVGCETIYHQLWRVSIWQARTLIFLLTHSITGQYDGFYDLLVLLFKQADKPILKLCSVFHLKELAVLLPGHYLC